MLESRAIVLNCSANDLLTLLETIVDICRNHCGHCLKRLGTTVLGERQMGIYQGLSEYKPDAQASASILAYTRLRFGLVLVRNYLPLALLCDSGLGCSALFVLKFTFRQPQQDR